MVAVLEITTVASCSVRCLICPQDLLKASYRKDSEHRLSIDDYLTIFVGLPKNTRIHFSGFVEPWLNPDCTEMLHIALRRGYRVAVYTTCVGMMDVMEAAGLLVRYHEQVDVICVHIPDGINMTTVSHSAMFINALMNAGLKPEIMMMNPTTGFTQVDRAGNVTPNLTRHRGPIRCSYTDGPDKYDHNVLLPNGDVHLCCMDYSLRHPLGNLFEQTWEEIQNGEPLRKLRDANATDGDTLCRRCHGAAPL